MPIERDAGGDKSGGSSPNIEGSDLASGWTDIKAEHEVKSGETLSDLALKYYGSAAKVNWMAIYKANKDKIGDDPKKIKPGQRLKIPKLS